MTRILSPTDRRPGFLNSAPTFDIRQHGLESGCFVVSATAWLDADQQAQIMKDTGCSIGPISSGCFTDGVHLSYDSMASFIAPYGSQAALAVARGLDAKIESLLEMAAR